MEECDFCGEKLVKELGNMINGKNDDFFSTPKEKRNYGVYLVREYYDNKDAEVRFEHVIKRKPICYECLKKQKWLDNNILNIL